MSTHRIVVVGPRDPRSSTVDLLTVSTVSHATGWEQQLSPFFLGPVPLYGGRVSRRMENAWQFSKVWKHHVGADGLPTAEYWPWAESGWANPAPVRYPMGKGSKPEYLFWDGRRLGYVDARKQVYWRLYRDAVRKTDGWQRLRQLHASQDVALWDFDGFDNETVGMSLADVIDQDRRPMGHAFVLKAMLLYGDQVEADEVRSLEAAAPARPVPHERRQRGLFD